MLLMQFYSFKYFLKLTNLCFMKILINILLLLLLVYTISCDKDDETEQNHNTWTYNIPQKVPGDWETASLDIEGFDIKPFSDMMNLLIKNNDNHGYHSILVVKNSKLVFEEYFSGFDRHYISSTTDGTTVFNKDTLHHLASVSKSITSACLGIAIDKGFINSVEDRIISFLPECTEYSNDQKNQISIKNCCTMRSGFPWDESTYPYNDSRNDLYKILSSLEPMKFYFNRELISSPGGEFLYNSGDAILLGELVHRSSGTSLVKFAEKYLFNPLGINSYDFWLLPYADSITFASGGLYLRPRDMAKIGQLYLNEGLWNGERIISENWVIESTNPSVNFTTNEQLNYQATGYSYQWWNEKFVKSGIQVLSFSARGLGEQYIVVVPEFELIIVMTGGFYDYSTARSLEWFDAIQNYILAALN